MRLAARLQLLSLAVVGATLIAILLFDASISAVDLIFPGITASLVGAGLAVVMARGLSRSLSELQEVMRDLARGDLAARPSLSAEGEIADVATALHRLSEHLESRMNV